MYKGRGFWHEKSPMVRGGPSGTRRDQWHEESPMARKEPFGMQNKKEDGLSKMKMYTKIAHKNLRLKS